MRIAFVSFEFEGSAVSGGIGTYVRNASNMLANRGHQVEVFTCGGDVFDAEQSGIRLHTIIADRANFAKAVLPAFAARHFEAPFDVVEGPDYGADASAIGSEFTTLPIIVKLHTPTFLVQKTNNAYLSLRNKARFMAGGLRRGRIATPYWVDRPKADPERAHAMAASEVTAPSRAVLDAVVRHWGLSTDRLACIPNPFSPNSALLETPADTSTNRVTFLGRLEARKGVIDLARAIPRVLDHWPAARFRLIGRSLLDPATGRDMQARMHQLIGRCADAVEFVGAVPYAEVPTYLSDTDICVFPSVWEASGFVCKEAMAAARGVVASGGSGMAEIIMDGRTGRLVPPRNPAALAAAILSLLKDPAQRIAMGLAARDHVVRTYSPETIAPLQEASYRRAIAHARLVVAMSGLG
jgi:glycosyltransferase involved in cell wall biosynthesis